MKPRIAVFLQPQHAEYDQIRKAAKESEEIGADVIYNWDHFYPLYKEDGTQWEQGERREGKHFECWTMLASWAELLADMARTVDHISDGRVILGIGSGWFAQDYEEYGYEFGTAIWRLKELEKSLERIVKRMSKLNPQPKRKIPILIGGGGEKVTLRLVAQYADIWHGFATKTEERSGIETVAHKNSVLNNWCSEVGRDPNEIQRSIGIDIKRIDLADDLLEAGATEVTLAVNGPGYDLSLVKEWIAWRDSKE